MAGFALAKQAPLAVGDGGLPGAAIESVALALPSQQRSNQPIAARLGVTSEWITSRTGVENRHIASAAETLCGLASEAGQRALERAGIAAADIDLLLVASWTQDELIPDAAPLVAANIGASRASAMDVGAACTAFVSALSHAASFIEVERAQTALVIGADLVSRHVDYDDKRTAGLFGDGAGAVVLTTCEAPGRIGPIILRSDGHASDLIHAGREEAVLRMRGYETYQHAVARLSEVTREACALAEVAVSAIDLFVYHQANSRILQAVAAELELPEKRVVDYVASFGNTSAASIPMALARAESEGRLTPGAQVLMGAFGAGLTWGAGIIEWKGTPLHRAW